MMLKDRVAIVTGAAQGLGKAYALRLAKEGAKVIIADIQDTQPVQEEIAATGAEALALYTDVADEESTQEMARKTIERFTNIDILINNAAVFSSIQTKPFFEISAQEWDDVIRVNLKGTFLCCKAVYPKMKSQGKGKIINISSGAAFKGLPDFIHYVTSKGGIISFTRALAREVGDDGICVNTIAPGFTLSDRMQKEPIHDENFINAILAGRCFKRQERPEDITGTVIFLASDQSDFITGQTILVDGGSVMH
jgi:NAD(P)-dependent dehydrogenase (short-subunit alcohol dehydrogenase family)